MTDEYLMEAVSAGKLDQSAVLYERYKRLIFSYFWKHGIGRDNSQDLTQQVFVRLISYRTSFKIGSVFKPWIYRIAHNVYVDFLKENSSIHVDIEDYKDSIEDVVNDSTEDKMLIRKALMMIPEEYKEVILLAKYEELKYEQIAETLNISVALVKVRVHRGIKALREAYLEIC